MTDQNKKTEFSGLNMKSLIGEPLKEACDAGSQLSQSTKEFINQIDEADKKKKNNEIKKLEVVAAILMHDNKIFCAQRPKGKYEYISYKFEFPGGKIEPNETAKEALCRELMEEMEVFVRVEDLKFYCTVEHQYPDFRITMHSFLCPIRSDEIQLKEHKSAVWLDKHELDKLDWAEADLPIISKLIKDASISE
ncbi:MAG: (deoxy)nucleoside triphosphate pyrophosphohydrolase [Anaerovorax sp.]|nr:(deoxy)nucleoside triphosphate pyrophosphohydrolase [Anaerovorax sp.]